MHEPTSTIFTGRKLRSKICKSETQCSGTELLYLVREIEMDETNLCTNPLALVKWFCESH